LEQRVFLTTATAYAGDDSYVRNGSSAGTNYGTAAQLQVKTIATSGFDRDAYLKFSVSVPNGNVVNSAILSVYGTAVVGSTYSGPAINDITLSAFPLTTPTASWAEGTINWNNRPALSGYTSHSAALDEATISTTGTGWHTLDLTSFINSEVAAGRSSITVGLHCVDTVDAQANLDSDEGTNRPKLDLDYSASGSLAVSGSTLSVAEAGSNSFNVHLAAAPANNVTVTVARQSGGDADLTSSPSTLTFTPSNWSTDQEVTISAAQDTDAAAGTATFNLSASGYTTASVVATEVDDDAVATPNDDTFVYQFAPTQAYGTSAVSSTFYQTLRVKQSTTGNAREIWLKFPMSSFPANVGTATLRLYGRAVETDSDNATSGTLAVNGNSNANTSWSEGTLTWNNRPTGTTSLSDQETITGASDHWYTWDVSSYVTQQRQAGASYVTLVLTGDTATTPMGRFLSKEAGSSTAPQLLVTAGTNAAPVITTAATASPSPVQGKTSTLSVGATDDGGAANLTYYWSSTNTPAGEVDFSSVNGTNSGSSITTTFSAAGSYDFAVAVVDGAGQVAVSSVSVVVQQAMTTIKVTPGGAPLQVPQHSSIALSATSLDQFGRGMVSQPPITWTVTGNGSVSSSGVFTAGSSSGRSTVTASWGSYSGTSIIAVGQIAGTLFYDPDADGLQDGNELGLDGWTVYYDTNGNSSKDSGEPSDTTDAFGDYAFDPPTGANCGSVQVVAPSGWQHTSGGGYDQGTAILQSLTATDNNSSNTASGGGSMDVITDSSGSGSIHINATVAPDSSAYGKAKYRITKLDGTLVTAGNLTAGGVNVSVPKGQLILQAGIAKGNTLDPREATQTIALAAAPKRVKCREGAIVGMVQQGAGFTVRLHADWVGTKPTNGTISATVKPVSGTTVSAVVQQVSSDAQGVVFDVTTTSTTSGDRWSVVFTPNDSGEPGATAVQIP
jgi:hypothetical protein